LECGDASDLHTEEFAESQPVSSKSGLRIFGLQYGIEERIGTREKG